MQEKLVSETAQKQASICRLQFLKTSLTFSTTSTIFRRFFNTFFTPLENFSMAITGKKSVLLSHHNFYNLWHFLISALLGNEITNSLIISPLRRPIENLKSHRSWLLTLSWFEHVMCWWQAFNCLLSQNSLPWSLFLTRSNEMSRTTNMILNPRTSQKMSQIKSDVDSYMAIWVWSGPQKHQSASISRNHQ